MKNQRKGIQLTLQLSKKGKGTRCIRICVLGLICGVWASI